MNRQAKQYDDDDDRVICNMDVDGMPWHDRRIRREQRAAKKSKIPPGEQLTNSEARKYNFYSLLAGLFIASVFSLTWILFVLFCTQIWFK